jgi:hypothetical protein
LGAEPCAPATTARYCSDGSANTSLVEDHSDKRAAVLRRYLELKPGARPFFPIDRRAPISDFEGIVHQYPVFRVA